MHRNLSMALLATVTVAGFTSTALAGSSDSYANGVPAQPTTVTTFTAAAPPVMETYTPPPRYVAPQPVAAPPPKDGFYDESRYGGNAEFGYKQQHACGGATTGDRCLVILSDHMRRVCLDGPAGTILVGNPLIADVTVLGNDTLFVSARTIGSTNIIVLDKSGNEMVTYEVFVREPRSKRVVLNNAGTVENYQCAPHCERALTQSDSPAPYQAKSAIISTDLGLDATAIGLQSGPNPNTAPSDSQNNGGGGAGLPSGLPSAGTAGGAGASGNLLGSDLSQSVEGLGQSLGPALGLAGAVESLLGGTTTAPTQGINGPARTDAPPLQ